MYRDHIREGVGFLLSDGAGFARTQGQARGSIPEGGGAPVVIERDVRDGIGQQQTGLVVARGNTAQRVAVSPREAAAMLGLSVNKTYELLNSGQLRSIKLGGRRLIAMSAIDALFAEEAA